VFTDEFPSDTVVELIVTFAPTAIIVELTTAIPILRSSGEIFAVDVEFAACNRVELASTFTVELPILISAVEIITFAPAANEVALAAIFAPINVPVLLIVTIPVDSPRGFKLAEEVEFAACTIVELTVLLTVELPTLRSVIDTITFAPAATTVLLTTDDPTTNPSGFILEVDVELASCNRIEFPVKLALEFPIFTSVTETTTLEPTARPLEFVVTDPTTNPCGLRFAVEDALERLRRDELDVELTVELPTHTEEELMTTFDPTLTTVLLTVTKLFTFSPFFTKKLEFDVATDSLSSRG